MIDLNYPSGLKKKLTTKNETLNKKIQYKNRGMALEDDINLSNQYYINIEKAFIYKKPTPIKLVKVDYKKGRIDEAYFAMPSTTDYNGIYNEKYIDFEAKETINEKGFPLVNIHKHQIQHLRNIQKAKGICFLIVRFTSKNITYLLMANDFLDYIDNHNKSVIPITYFQEKGYVIKDKFMPRIDYLEIIDKMECDKNEKKRKERKEK